MSGPHIVLNGTWLGKRDTFRMNVPGGRVTFTHRDKNELGDVFASIHYEPIRSGLMRFERRRA